MAHIDQKNIDQKNIDQKTAQKADQGITQKKIAGQVNVANATSADTASKLGKALVERLAGLALIPAGGSQASQVATAVSENPFKTGKLTTEKDFQMISALVHRVKKEMENS